MGDVDASSCGSLEVRQNGAVIPATFTVEGSSHGHWAQFAIQAVTSAAGSGPGVITISACPNFPVTDQARAHHAYGNGFVGLPTRNLTGTVEMFPPFFGADRFILIGDDDNDWIGGASSPGLSTALPSGSRLSLNVAYRSDTETAAGDGFLTEDQYTSQMYALGLMVFLLAALLVSSWRSRRG